MKPRTTSPRRRPQLSRRRLVVGGLTLTTLALAGTGATAVAAPDSAVGQAVGSALGVVDIEAQDTTPVLTDAQMTAYWGAGYTWADTDALAALWQTDWAGVKARAGQMILDGQTLPIAPGTNQDVEEDLGYTDEQMAAFWDAGYTVEDADALAALWQTDWSGVKAQAGQMILDGQTPPIAPGSSVAGS